MKGKRNEKVSNSKSKRRISAHLKEVNLYAAGIDVGSEEHFVAVAESLDDEPIRSFNSFTADLNSLADWLLDIGIQTVAMESTGISWIPLFEILDAKGLEVLLVNARHVKNVPGRKSDVLDCQWLQQLHTYGLLRGAFRPTEQIAVLRSYTRQRSTLIRHASTQIQLMQKALRQMNLLLDNAVSQVTGKTGMSIIRAILDGQHDPEKLSEFRDPRCKKSKEVIALSLEGNYREEHLFALKQAVELYDHYQKLILDCNSKIKCKLEGFEAKCSPEQRPEATRSKGSKNSLSFDGRTKLHRMCGVDLVCIPSIDEVTVLKVISETGTDMNRWKTEKHFASWLALSPGSKISGGKVLDAKTKQSANRAAAALRMAVPSLIRSQTAMGAYYRRMRTKLGTPKAVTATAHKLARLFYTMLKNGTEYVEKGVECYEQQYQDRVLRNLRKRAAHFGFQLIESPDNHQNANISPSIV